jgi:short-subunit dehydrogenase
MFNRPLKEASRTLLDKATSLCDVAVAAALTGGTTISGMPIRHRLFQQPSLRDLMAGRTVLVSGASSGIGRAVARKAAEAGATVVLVARSQEKLETLATEIEQSGGRALVYKADLSSAPSTELLLSMLSRDRVEIDVLVNSAGRSIRRPVGDSYARVHDYERTMALNYFGSLRLVLGLLPGMRKRRRGHVINVSSAGVQMGTPLFSAYVASKAALDAFTRVVASESRGEGVHFTTVHMPLVRTPMIAPTADYEQAPALTPDEAADVVLRPIITEEAHIGTRLASIFTLGHVVLPDLLDELLAWGHRQMAKKTRNSTPPTSLDGPERHWSPVPRACLTLGRSNRNLGMLLQPSP